MASNSSDGEQTFRMRFYNFNMANSNTFEGLHQLQGALGRSLEDWIQEPFPDGQSCDAVFVTLTETRLHLGPWVREYRSHSNSKLDCATYQNSVKEADKTNDMPWSGMLDGMAEKYNGNLKTLLLFSRSRFRGDPEMSPLFGRLTDKRLAGVALPNPKKAFMGRSLLSRQGPLHVCFAGAHFPIAEVAAALDDSQNPLETSKVIMARILRRVLRNASYHGLLSENTLLLLQGDLNSRTVLVDGVKDILKEVMADTKLQAAIRHSLPVPEGEWFEPSGRTSALNLPVTYKFSSEVGTAFKQADSSLSLEEVLAATPCRPSDGAYAAKLGSLSLEEVLAATPCRPSDGAYAATLQSVPPDVLKGWSLDFKEANFRNFRFPAAADRLICWAPKDLARRLQWSFPQGGYEVNHKQGGSDHRPVRLEVQLTLQPSREEPVKGEELELPPDLLQAVAEDEEGDGGESPGLLNSLASAAGTAKFSFGNWFSRQPDGYSLK